MCTGKKPYYLLSGHPQTQAASELLLLKLTTFKRYVTELAMSPEEPVQGECGRGFMCTSTLIVATFYSDQALSRDPRVKYS